MVATTTKLEAVNVMLSVIDEQPVTALAENADATAAETLLDEVNKRIQAKGWYFNTIIMDFTASDPDGFVVLPGNTMAFDFPRTSSDDPELVFRQRTGAGDIEAYDVLTNTNVFTVGRVFKDCVIVQAQEFDQLPESARQYIMISAARQFQDRTLGSGGRSRFTRGDEGQAMAALNREENKSGDFNIFETFIPNIVRRRNPPLYRRF